MTPGINPFVFPQGPSAPIATSFLLGELNAVEVLEKDATGPQRVISIGSAIPVVFCKFADNAGGAWVSPPAARYGLQLTDSGTNSFSFGMVISEGRIGDIAEGDIYKGTFLLENLSNTGFTLNYGSMPTSGYDYSFSSTTTTPGIPGTPDETVTTVTEDAADKVQLAAWNAIVYTNAFSISAASSLSFTLNIYKQYVIDKDTTYQFFARVLKNALVVAETSGLVSSFSFSDDNNQVDAQYIVQIKKPADQDRIAVDAVFSPFRSTRHTTTVVPGTPEVPPVYTTVGLPLSPGSGGTFAGMSCLAVKGTYTQDALIGDYREQVRCFVRNGIKVKNLSTDVVESSSNFIDLAYYLLKANKISDELIDIEGLKTARNFLEANNLRYNGVLASSVNIREFFAAVAPGLLLRFVQDAGRFSFKPVLPVTLAGSIDVASIPPVKIFTNQNIISGSLSKNYYSSQLRKPVCVLLSWREQFKQAYSVTVTSEIRYINAAIDGPFESYDFSDFITDTNHAALVGKYILASRARTTHSIRFATYFDDTISSGKLVGELQPLDVIQVVAGATTNSDIVTINDFYQVSTISEAPDGNFEIEAIHFPVDSGGASLIAADMFGNQYAVS